MTPFDGEIGPERYRITVPPLAFPDYARVQRLMLGGLRRRSVLRSFLIFLTLFALGAALGVSVAYADVYATLVMGTFRFGASVVWSGGELLLAACIAGFGLVLLLVLVGQRRHRRLLRRFHESSQAVDSPLELALGEAGLIAATALSRTSLPWRAITAYAAHKGMHYLVIDRLSALWIPESVLAGRPDRDDLIAFLREKVPASGARTSP